jgi:FRG domain
MADDKAKSLGRFVDRVAELRQFWGLPEDKELWFRGERRIYPTILRPQLYRPPMGRTLKPVPELLKIENTLYEDFQRCAVQLCNEKVSEEDWDWDSYFLMQHHNAPTRLLDWSDGALMALHFAVREKRNDDTADPIVYVMEPYRLLAELKALPEAELAKKQWKDYVAKHATEDLSEDDWEDAYLPADEEDLTELPMPPLPLLLDFSHITRRIAAQRSRFIVFGTDEAWLAKKFETPDSPIKAITIDGGSCRQIRTQLYDSGITESVIYPDLDGLGREMKQRWEDLK